MPLKKVCSVKAFRDNIRMAIREGYPREQAVAMAFETLRRACGAPPRAREEQWPPEKIVKWKKEGMEVIEQVLDDMNEEELTLLCNGLEQLQKMDKEELKKMGLDETIGPVKILGRPETDVEVAEPEDKDVTEPEEEEEEFAVERLSHSELDEFRKKVATAIVLAFAEVLEDYDVEKIHSDDLQQLLNLVRDEARKIAMKLPMLARTELRRLKTLGTERFIQWFRRQLAEL